MDFAHWFLVLCAVVAFYNLGVIWFAQVVVYPLFGQVRSAEYRAYHLFYSSRIWLPVIVPGFACFLLPVGLIFLRPATVPQWLALANAACGIVALLVTVALEIPRHARLEKGGKQGEVIRELILYKPQWDAPSVTMTRFEEGVKALGQNATNINFRVLEPSIREAYA